MPDAHSPNKRRVLVYVSLAVILICVVLFLANRPAKQPATTENVPTAPPPVVVQQPKLDEPKAPTVEPMPLSGNVIRGRVTNQHGRPAKGLSVGFLGRSNPLGEKAQGVTSLTPSGNLTGPTFTTNDKGEFEGTLPAQEEVFVTPLSSSARFRVRYDIGRWVAPPASGVDFQIEEVATATLKVRVFDEALGSYLKEFRCGFGGIGGGYHQGTTKTEVLELLVPFKADQVQLEGTVRLVTPKREGLPLLRVTLAPEELKEVEFRLRNSKVVRGRVMDRRGKPIKGASVFFGSIGKEGFGEPLKAFDPKRALGLVETDESGQFTIAGDDPFITAWHPDFSSTTVASEAAHEIRLLDKATLSLVIVDKDGRPVSGKSITLDGSVTLTSDDMGRVEFPNAMYGVRQLKSDDGLLTVVAFSPDNQGPITLNPGLSVTLSGVDLLGESGASFVLVGTATKSSFREVRATGSTVTLDDIIPGKYYLLTPKGRLGYCEIDGPRTSVVVGSANVEVHAAEGLRFYLTPPSANGLVDLLAGKLTSAATDSQGVIRFLAVPPGTYELKTLTGLSLKTVSMGSQTEVIRIR